jgi:hypothetical protein
MMKCVGIVEWLSYCQLFTKAAAHLGSVGSRGENTAFLWLDLCGKLRFGNQDPGKAFAAAEQRVGINCCWRDKGPLSGLHWRLNPCGCNSLQGLSRWEGKYRNEGLLMLATTSQKCRRVHFWVNRTTRNRSDFRNTELKKIKYRTSIKITIHFEKHSFLIYIYFLY